jgi:acetolactate synthase-1/2/3 large subunit
VYVTLDAELQEMAIPAGVSMPDQRLARPASGPAGDADQVMAVARLLTAASEPVVVGGRLGLDPAATPLLTGLVEQLGAGYRDDRNVVAFPTGHPHNLSGDTETLRRADAVLAVDLADLGWAGGRTQSSRDRPSDRRGDGHVPSQHLAAITLDPVAPSGWANAGQVPVPVDVLLVADATTALRQLHDAISDLLSAEPVGDRRRREERCAEIAWRHEQLRERQRLAVDATSTQVPIAPPWLSASVWRAVRDRSWLLTLRNTRTWPEGVWQFPGAGSYLGHSGGGGVGYGPGAMVGGALAARDRGQVAVAIIGDGDLLMAPGALWTAVHYEIPLLVVVNNNRSFFNDEEHQQVVARQRGRPEVNAWIGMRVDRPAIDFAALAHTYGAWAQQPVTHPDALPGALDAALAAVDDGRVALVDVHTSGA